jgi:hypothetical protein
MLSKIRPNSSISYIALLLCFYAAISFIHSSFLVFSRVWNGKTSGPDKIWLNRITLPVSLSHIDPEVIRQAPAFETVLVGWVCGESLRILVFLWGKHILKEAKLLWSIGASSLKPYQIYRPRNIERSSMCFSQKTDIQ